MALLKNHEVGDLVLPGKDLKNVLTMV